MIETQLEWIQNNAYLGDASLFQKIVQNFGANHFTAVIELVLGVFTETRRVGIDGGTSITKGFENFFEFQDTRVDLGLFLFTFAEGAKLADKELAYFWFTATTFTAVDRKWEREVEKK